MSDMGLLEQAEQLPAQPTQQPVTDPSQQQQPLPDPAAQAVQQPSVGDEQPSGEEQAAYEEGMDELGKILYENEQTSSALVNMVQAGDKVGTTAKTVTQLITQMDEKIDLDESTVHSLTVEAADRLMELVEQTNEEITYSDREVQQVYMTAWEAVLGIFGGEDSMKESYAALSPSVSDQDITSAQTKYGEIMNG